jgi:hypothetical protein
MEEVVVAKFKVLSWNLPGRTEETMKNFGQHSMTPGPPKYKAGMLTIWP